MMKIQFKDDFYWGSAISALQTEGHYNSIKGKSTWDKWLEIDKEKFFDSGSNEIAVDFFNRYREDVRLMKELNHNSFRFSISWTRLIPDPINKPNEINQEAVDYYRNLIQTLKANQIEPFVCLFHFDMPLAIQEIGGWESKETLKHFVQYAKVCFDLFGSEVKYWFTHNEPIVPIEGCYFYGFHYPQILDFKRGFQALYYTVLSNAMVIEEFKKYKQLRQVNAKIGIVLSLTPCYPATKEDEEVAKIANLIFVDSFLSPCVKGEFNSDFISFLKENDAMFVFTEDEIELIKKNMVDLLGVNYYFPRRVKQRKNGFEIPAKNPHSFFEDYVKPNRRFNKDRGWEIYPKGLYDILMRIKNEFDNIPVYISENGIGRNKGEIDDMDEHGIIHDTDRIEFLKEHLFWLNKSIQAGSNCFGYHMWTLMDNWSMSNAYKNKYGFIHIDRENNLKRTIKQSGRWFSKVSKQGYFEITEEENEQFLNNA